MQLEKGTIQPLQVAYILLRFPKLTETFIAQEIRSLRSHDIDVRIISLLKAGPGPAQPLSQQLLRNTWYAPRLLTCKIWRAQLHFLLKSPRLYLVLFAKLLFQPCPGVPFALFLKRLVVFLKAVSVAYYLQDSGVQVLHAHFAWLSGAAAWVCARLLEIPFTVTVHAFDIYSSRNDLLRLVTREANHVIAISEFNRRHVEALGTCTPKALAVIHCGVNIKEFEGKSAERWERPIRGPLKILSVGRLISKKGYHILIAACQLLEGKGLDFTCTIIGSGPEEIALRRQISACGLQHRVELQGARSFPKIIDAYRQHDVFALACMVAPDGDMDGIPVVLMEAGLMSLPLISTSVSGIPELIRHTQTGLLVPPGDAAALADAIAALAADPGMRARLGKNVRALVQSQFDIESSTLQLAALFREISRRRKPNFSAI